MSMSMLFPLFHQNFKLPVKWTLSTRKHHPKTSCYCLGEAHKLYQSLYKLEIKWLEIVRKKKNKQLLCCNIKLKISLSYWPKSVTKCHRQWQISFSGCHILGGWELRLSVKQQQRKIICLCSKWLGVAVLQVPKGERKKIIA